MPAPGGLSTIWANRVATNYTWAALLLKNIGAPVSTNNIQNVVRWMTAEKPANNWYQRNNPLNASLGTSASDGTGSYPDLTTAAQNTAIMIVQGYKGGAIGDQIYNALQSNASPDAFSQAVVDSNWSSAHYGVLAAGAPAAAAVPGRMPTYLSSLNLPATVTAPSNVASGSGNPNGLGVAQAAAGGSASTSTGTGCSSRGATTIFPGLLGVGKVQITACNYKAWTAGLSIVAGGFIMLAGAFLLVSATKPGQDIIEQVKAGGKKAAEAAVIA